MLLFHIAIYIDLLKYKIEIGKREIEVLLSTHLAYLVA